MTDLYQFSSSTPPQMVSKQFIQEIEKIVALLQKQISDLRTDINEPEEKTNRSLKLIQDAELLIQLQDATRIYLNKYRVNSLTKTIQPDNQSQFASMEMLETFVWESRHPIASIQGRAKIIASSSNEQLLKLQIFDKFNMTLLALTSMCAKMKEVVETK